MKNPELQNNTAFLDQELENHELESINGGVTLGGCIVLPSSVILPIVLPPYLDIKEDKKENVNVENKI